MLRIITSQHYLDDEIVSEKVLAGDFAVSLSPEFEIDGDMYQVVLDGHHSLAAALAAGVDPDYTILTATEHDAIGWLKAGRVDTFLEAVWLGCDYIDAITHEDVW